MRKNTRNLFQYRELAAMTLLSLYEFYIDKQHKNIAMHNNMRRRQFRIQRQLHSCDEKQKKYIKLEIAAQGIAQCKVSATRVVVDAALRRIG